MVAPAKRMTVEAFDTFADLPENADKLLEFVGGEVVEVPSNPFSSNIGGWILTFINMYLLKNPIGFTTGEQGGYRVAGERYVPDVGFVRKEIQQKPVTQGYNPNPPNLAVEVMSPSDNPRELRIKITNYLNAGTQVWVVYPPEREVEIHAPGKPVEVLTVDETLDGGDLLPGFTLAVKDIFQSVDDNAID